MLKPVLWQIDERIIRGIQIDSFPCDLRRLAGRRELTPTIFYARTIPPVKTFGFDFPPLGQGGLMCASIISSFRTRGLAEHKKMAHCEVQCATNKYIDLSESVNDCTLCFLVEDVDTVEIECDLDCIAGLCC